MDLPVSQWIVHVLVTALLPPLMLGVVNRVKAKFGGRVGPPLLQLYYDLFKLWHKGFVLSGMTTWIFRLGPVVGLATVAVASLFVPLGGAAAPLHFTGDVFLFAYLLALARFFTIIAALDTGSAFEGMGTAREATYACLAEPTLLFGFLVLAKSSGSLQLATMLSTSAGENWGLSGAAMLLVVVSWFIVLLVENCRIPFDDPNTHLELTMIHEVMVLDHGGPLFGLILYGAALKLFVFAALIVRLLIPLQGAVNVWIGWSGFVVAMLVVAAVLGVVESVMARLKLVAIPRMLVAACVISAFGFVLLLTKV